MTDRMERFETLVLPHLPETFDRQATLEFLKRHKFTEAPASTKYHGAWPGGWFDHSLCGMEQLVRMTEQFGLVWQRPESPYLVGFFHDLCKLDQYARLPGGKGEPPQYCHNPVQLLKGHGDKSVMLLSTLGRLTEEEVACIRYHMGAFTESRLWSEYTGGIHRWPNVLWTHTADMVASHVFDK